MAARNWSPCLHPGANPMRIYGRTGWCSQPRLLRVVPLLAPLIFVCCCPLAAADGLNQARLVVVLYPQNNDGSPGNALVDQSLRSMFAADSAERIEVYDEYLDVSQARDPGDQQFQVEHLTRIYAGRGVQRVIAALDLRLLVAV